MSPDERREYDLHGPWTGVALNPIKRRMYLKHREWIIPVSLAILSIAVSATMIVLLVSK